MEATALKALAIAAAAPFYYFPPFRNTASPFLFRSPTCNPPRFHLSLSSPPLCSLGEGRTETALPHGAGDSLTSEVSHHNILQVVLVSPQIPGNTGCIARTCAASAVGLHLVGPIGFQIDDAKLKRAGLDYWPFVVVKVHNSWAEFKHYFIQQAGEKRLLAFTKRGTNIHSKPVAYQMRPCKTAKVKNLVEGLLKFRWLKLMLDVSISLLALA
ncbi:uncharacterized protein LOC133799628 isoform X2 [Humulus lupulus]|uniref:uncharacterized protein LOC133799628 isoform X2 n=1 Tax=Humulus lupulus TaxID=3486 RepID=UPI002B4115BB|nr:uncharacterized protein LOC133799628 isoform X2 [Humulus lupulus]